MKDYTHNGEALPADLLDKIADDVRGFDRAQSPEVRQALSIKDIAGHLTRIRDELVKTNEQARKDGMTAERAALALEVQAAISLGAAVTYRISTARDGDVRQVHFQYAEPEDYDVMDSIL